MTQPDAAAGSGFRPTHVVPYGGLPAWEAPDASRPTATLDPLLPVQLLSRRGDWGEILCGNGWSAWVDGRLLVTVPQPPDTADRPITRGGDPRPLLARAAGALDRYRAAAADLAAGTSDAAAFRDATRGLRAGVVVDGERVWLYDEATDQWSYGDGTGLTTFAAGTAPSPEQPPAAGPDPAAATGRAPTRVTPPTDPAGAR
ncbi:hypothetical protein [Streptomyces sp. NPDC012888]|uniref:hypothetical protein n=1 Tax=Streptomyces sp. NPDC012888 TaxID=3364855 RepID=UPI0036D18CB8